MHRLSRRGALLALGAAVLAGCTGTGTDKDQADMDLSATESAVQAASSRVTGFKSTERRNDGLEHTLFMNLQLDTAAPLTAEELDAIVKAIWTTVPFEPIAIDLVVGLVDAGDPPVDLRAAGGELSPMHSAAYGQGGVTLTHMDERYGAWKKPA